MRITSLSILLCMLFSCGQSGSGSQEAEAPSLYGTFSRGADSLWVQEYESPIEEQVNFQFYAVNDQVSFNQADYADFLEATEDEDIYVFKDTAQLVYSDLILTFSYVTGNWEVQDVAFRDSLVTDMDLSGEWIRVKK